MLQQFAEKREFEKEEENNLDSNNHPQTKKLKILHSDTTTALEERILSLEHSNQLLSQRVSSLEHSLQLILESSNSKKTRSKTTKPRKQKGNEPSQEEGSTETGHSTQHPADQVDSTLSSSSHSNTNNNNNTDELEQQNNGFWICFNDDFKHAFLYPPSTIGMLNENNYLTGAMNVSSSSSCTGSASLGSKSNPLELPPGIDSALKKHLKNHFTNGVDIYPDLNKKILPKLENAANLLCCASLYVQLMLSKLYSILEKDSSLNSKYQRYLASLSKKKSSNNKEQAWYDLFLEEIVICYQYLLKVLEQEGSLEYLEHKTRTLLQSPSVSVDVLEEVVSRGGNDSNSIIRKFTIRGLDNHENVSLLFSWALRELQKGHSENFQCMMALMLYKYSDQDKALEMLKKNESGIAQQFLANLVDLNSSSDQEDISEQDSLEGDSQEEEE
ncbi:hypothetical protein C9374_011036 [Naegleria lovaniensis]|uniref:Uncharacterized protein n=1 Tax=Naegleria lovaniensis TaxID=51637 RepID=A0AA88GF13_NAELO|nr:uncharacterized protein C9374_011036 [Naegleria lovaniensis]KAG2374199.1 hypothetical protein C9374_011036 [Naegleria lovaniensis]